MEKPIIFTDLDGTLLDSTYSFDSAMPALQLLKEKNIPLIICSSKTRKEIEYYRKKFGDIHIFLQASFKLSIRAKIWIVKYSLDIKVCSVLKFQTSQSTTEEQIIWRLNA